MIDSDDSLMSRPALDREVIGRAGESQLFSDPSE